MAFTFGVAVVVGGVIALALGSWWILIGAVAAHALGTGIVLGLVRNRLQEEEKPDPLTEARLTEPERQH